MHPASAPASAGVGRPALRASHAGLPTLPGASGGERRNFRELRVQIAEPQLLVICMNMIALWFMKDFEYKLF